MHRLYNMVRIVAELGFSRQRAWGVPLPLFYGDDNDQISHRKQQTMFKIIWEFRFQCLV